MMLSPLFISIVPTTSILLFRAIPDIRDNGTVYVDIETSHFFLPSHLAGGRGSVTHVKLALSPARSILTTSFYCCSSNTGPSTSIPPIFYRNRHIWELFIISKQVPVKISQYHIGTYLSAKTNTMQEGTRQHDRIKASLPYYEEGAEVYSSPWRVYICTAG